MKLAGFGILFKIDMIPILFNILFFVIPLIFYKNTSEIFEFNKIIALYSLTALIVSAWAIQSIRIKKFIFKRTILDIPLAIYLFILLISTLFSIDPRTSWLGYYSRFNGGLISQICYALLYWAFVSNLNAKHALHSTYYMLLSGIIAGTLAISEKFGLFTTCGLIGFSFKESCWVQDVQARVFSTLGQPNWLAALIVALTPLAFKKSFKHYLIVIIFFLTLLFTKSRSGLMGFVVTSLIFWSFSFYQTKLKYLSHFVILNTIFIFLFFAFNPLANTKPVTTSNTPVLESGGTESGTIRKYVWLGAFEVFKHYPILGSGPETFAFSFPMYKPVEHNLTSEWDYIYNKAHNEFLNYLANTGIFGITAYLSLIVYSFVIFHKSKRFDLLSGYVAILITNFFGFSVVPISILFFLFPALALASDQEITSTKQNKLNLSQKIAIITVLFATYYILHTTYYYWKADIYYNSQKFEEALEISPDEPNYIAKLALKNGDSDTAFKAYKLNPYNQNTRRILISNLVNNSSKNNKNLSIAENIILDGIDNAPNDPKLYYQLGILQLKLEKNDEAIKALEKSVELKPNYKEGRFALGVTYKALKENKKAKEEFEYILKNIDPNDELTKKYLEELK